MEVGSWTPRLGEPRELEFEPTHKNILGPVKGDCEFGIVYANPQLVQAASWDC